MRYFAAMLIATVWSTFVAAQPPHQIMLDAYADLSTASAEAVPYIRYLSLANLKEDKENYQKYIGLLSGHLNSLSRYAKIVPPKLVKDYLLKFDIRDYQWDPKVYEQFAEDDPYFHVRAVLVPAYVTGKQPDPVKKDDKQDAKKDDKAVVKKDESKSLWAPWLIKDDDSAKKLEKLYEVTGSTTIVLRADWFFHQTAISEKRRVGYYGLLGIKKIEDFEAAMRFDRKLAKDLERVRVVVSSDITLEPRRLEGTRSATGDVWRTFDSEEAVGKKNPLVFLDDELEFDASEQFGHLPNGLPVWWLGNGKNVRQDKAPDQVVGGDRTKAGEHRGRGNDRRLHVNLSCIRCHFVGKNSGVKDFNHEHIDWIKSPDYEKLKELQSKYLEEIDSRVAASRLVYETSVKRASGMATKDYGEAYDEFWSRYDNAHIDLKRGAIELGVTPEEFKAGLERQEKIIGYVHPLLSIIKNGGYIPINQWQEVYSLSHAVIRGVQP